MADDVRHRPVVLQRDQDVRPFQVAVDDAFLVRVLDAVADVEEQFDTRAYAAGGCLVGIGHLG